jgi:hypothetical protein
MPASGDEDGVRALPLASIYPCGSATTRHTAIRPAASADLRQSASETTMIGDTLTPRQTLQIAANGPRLCLLYVANAPPRPATGENWETFLLACLARAHHTLRRMLDHPDEIDGAALARIVYEHVIAFAWVAIEPSGNYRQFLRWEYLQREKMRKDLEQFGEVAPDHASVRRALIDMAPDSAPETPDRALAAERFWSRCVQPEWHFQFRRVYANLFRPYSAFVHPTVMGLDPFIEVGSSRPRIGDPREVGNGHILAGAVVSFADGLIVASHRMGWPPMIAVVEAMMHGIEY